MRLILSYYTWDIYTVWMNFFVMAAMFTLWVPMLVLLNTKSWPTCCGYTGDVYEAQGFSFKPWIIFFYCRLPSLPISRLACCLCSFGVCQFWNFFGPSGWRPTLSPFPFWPSLNNKFFHVVMPGDVSEKLQNPLVCHRWQSLYGFNLI